MTLISGYTLHIFQFSDNWKSSINVNTCIEAKGMFKDNVNIDKLGDSLNDFDYVYQNCDNILKGNLLPTVLDLFITVNTTNNWL
jgi:hypothetical protein